MSQSDKSRYYNALKSAGVQFDKHFRNYTTDELEQAYAALQAEWGDAAPPLEEPEADEARQPSAPTGIQIPVKPKDENEVAGIRLNTQAEDEPIRVDPENGRIWYQEEVRKSLGAKPRGRRVLQVRDPGVERRTVQNGDYTEEFEVAGKLSVPGQIKVTLPAYQVGIYKDPNMPFKIHVYRDERGFDFFEVNDYYGGADMVPSEIKRMYVENDLCYDIRTVVRAIQTEARQLQLAGRI